MDENLHRIDRCICGKLKDDHFIDYNNPMLSGETGWNLFVGTMYMPGLCNENDRTSIYTQMTPLELAVWIEEQYERRPTNV